MKKKKVLTDKEVEERRHKLIWSLGLVAWYDYCLEELEEIALLVGLQLED